MYGRDLRALVQGHFLRRRNLKTYAALFLRLGLPSTLIRHENAALFLRLGLPTTLIRHENAALFLRLGLPSTLIRHENALQTGENTGFSFSSGQKTF